MMIVNGKAVTINDIVEDFNKEFEAIREKVVVMELLSNESPMSNVIKFLK